MTTPSHPRPRWLLAILTACVAVGLVALVLSVQNALAIDEQAEQRERQSIAADLAACERGNVLRKQIIDGHRANDELIGGVLDTFLAPLEADPVRAERVARLRADLAPLFDQYRSIVDGIVLTDCDALIASRGKS